MRRLLFSAEIKRWPLWHRDHRDGPNRQTAFFREVVERSSVLLQHIDRPLEHDRLLGLSLIARLLSLPAPLVQLGDGSAVGMFGHHSEFPAAEE